LPPRLGALSFLTPGASWPRNRGAADARHAGAELADLGRDDRVADHRYPNVVIDAAFRTR